MVYHYSLPLRNLPPIKNIGSTTLLSKHKRNLNLILDDEAFVLLDTGCNKPVISTSGWRYCSQRLMLYEQPKMFPLILVTS